MVRLYKKENDYYNLIEGILPDHFWITEISIPELYWVNDCKVGEIIFDPKLFNEKIDEPQKSVILLRLPNIMTVYQNKNAWDLELNQDKAYHPLIKKAKGLIRP